jgi:integrase
MLTRKVRDKFPLWLHPSGQWAKKHRGHFHYFGTDRDAALKRFAVEWDDIKAGRKHRPKRDETAAVLGDVVNAFLTAKRERVNTGEISDAMWGQYYATCDKVIDQFGRGRTVSDIQPEEFAKLRAKVATSVGPVTLLGFVTKTRVLFKFAYDFGLIEHPVRYGNAFDRPSRKTLRLNRASKRPKLFAAGDIWKLIDAADPQLAAMILLGINGGMGATDCAHLTRAMLSSCPGWLDFPRPKTGTKRRFPLWPETVSALELVRENRPEPKDRAYADRVLLTRTGQPWVRFSGDDKGKRSVMDAVAWQFKKLTERTGIFGSFYALRHTFRTVADEVPDQPAINFIMGHFDNSMADQYRERISDERIKAVTDHVRAWLLAGRKEPKRARK